MGTVNKIDLIKLLEEICKPIGFILDMDSVRKMNKAELMDLVQDCRYVLYEVLEGYLTSELEGDECECDGDCDDCSC